ncbi:Tyrosine--tRNA ligase OS=Tsukamurella paurometabola (strain ATCC 8368 / DSM / CCUG 35730 / CIP 100753 / JCM 10117 / KCTC 9821 / NBRC 16120 / NCIMB 702349/ NCTC 13040) OX=521096 GN=tyrS PE=3 SV=1 [Tsukamurella paurometabola]|uniref:Tyrosine--tRNA ligase n=1 Tax=Tsukamurella paurometabola (strain ATCC 8368 / DSM 20162 / CCUG 35730 / CIP 100753 / JCM 10117 / KCTC 9821 / NBRC 16120 / NCIMB 702349 / NCTC 13040) TaxID=521096 RepID=D5UR05_TSUPD|nr:tyrosine--tRNA ligase [Tsukamurella paurometabola]ADG78994.1 tyrosyl-tRNA synthetase [Tsukamurella paurometabola DSM 20162]SUP33721.1 Tyrosine--tRNA ligase [Tsukamurella paurometabola]
MSADILEELSWRGLIAQSTDLEALRERLAAGPITLYAGFDPTASSLHAGHLVQLLTLRRFQEAGHRPIVLGGGATGQVGDPRDVGERVMNSVDTVAEWAAKIDTQLQRFVSFEGENAAILVNNLDWHGQMNVPTFLRDVGKHFSINVMLARDTVKRRLESDGISYTEFSYMLLQAYDYVELARRYDAALQTGGSDQWGNIVAGVDLNRKIDGRHVHALTTQLVTSSDGKKFGKSTGGGSLWLDPELTSPYAWYQYFVNTADADVIRYLRWFTFLSKDEIDELERETTEAPQKRTAQKRLAAEMTTLVHGADQTRAVELASQALFGRGDLADLPESTLAAALEEASVAEVRAGEPRTIVDLLVATGLSDSKGAARRAVREGGAYANNVKIESEDWEPTAGGLLHGSWLVLRRGKKSFAGARFL